MGGSWLHLEAFEGIRHLHGKKGVHRKGYLGKHSDGA